MGLFVLVLALVGIVRMARTRGASSWLYGLLAGVGWFVLGILVANLLALLGFVAPAGNLTFGATLVATVIPWLWVGLVGLYVRFGVGRGVESPSGSWSCPSCRSINQSYALKCDSCGEAFNGGRAV
jgi:hypothetical protein